MNIRAWFSFTRRSAAAGSKTTGFQQCFSSSALRDITSGDYYCLVRVWGHRWANNLGTTGCGRRHSQVGAVSLRRAGRANHNSSHRSTWLTGSGMGGLLSLALLAVMGIRLVFLRDQLYDGWRWRHHPPVEVAHAGPDREHSWHIDVWIIGQPFVCDCHAARGKRTVI